MDGTYFPSHIKHFRAGGAEYSLLLSPQAPVSHGSYLCASEPCFLKIQHIGASVGKRGTKGKSTGWGAGECPKQRIGLGHYPPSSFLRAKGSK